MQKQNPIRNIETTEDLAAFCAGLAQERYVTVDTEFLRETTYYPKLCLVQVAGTHDAALIDPLAPGIDLAPFLALMANESVLKVFHAARQDVEIILRLSGHVPKPIFDTQIAAMVCGFGDQVGYEAIARKLANAQIDKSSQFTDWSRRPLTQKQMAYALSDVTHLRTVFEALEKHIAASGRMSWLEGELADLADGQSYVVDPAQSWRRIKARIQSKKQQAALMEVAAWREREAQSRDVPRGRVIKDEAVAEIAIQVPQSREDIQQLRLLGKGNADRSITDGILNAVKSALASDLEKIPSPRQKGDEMTPAQEAAAEVLRLALKIVSDNEGIAPKLLSNSAEIDQLAINDEADVAVLKGWRREAFGEIALDLKHGRAVIGLKDGRAEIRRI
jgi:ribonuclease D